MTTLTTIDLAQLATVHGGETNKSSVNIGATIPTEAGPAQIGLQGNDERTNYAVCAAPFQPGLRAASSRVASDPSPPNLNALSSISSALTGACGQPPAGAGQ